MDGDADASGEAAGDVISRLLSYVQVVRAGVGEAILW